MLIIGYPIADTRGRHAGPKVPYVCVCGYSCHFCNGCLVETWEWANFWTWAWSFGLLWRCFCLGVFLDDFIEPYPLCKLSRKILIGYAEQGSRVFTIFWSWISSEPAKLFALFLHVGWNYQMQHDGFNTKVSDNFRHLSFRTLFNGHNIERDRASYCRLKWFRQHSFAP